MDKYNINFIKYIYEIDSNSQIIKLINNNEKRINNYILYLNCFEYNYEKE